MQKPSFFIAGNSKSGTTALFAFLEAHPSIFMCRPKEPNYFARDFCRDPNPRGSFYARSEAEYLALFDRARPDQLCGEASACYLYSKEAARAIHAFDPEAKIIVMLREPVDFLYSYHLQQLKNPITEGEQEKNFSRALALEAERRAGRRIPRNCYLPEFLFYSERVKYAEQLERFYAVFPPEQVLVVIYDDFRRDNAAVYRQVLDFLGVDADFTPAFKVHNRGSELRSKTLQELVLRVIFGEGWAAPMKRVLKGLLPAQLRRRWVDYIYQRVAFRPKAGPDPALVRQLKRQFRTEVEKVSALLGRDLVTLWGYDEGAPSRPKAAKVPHVVTA